MKPDFSGQTVLVTGASRGIGLGIARAFAAAGADLHMLADDPAVEPAAIDARREGPDRRHHRRGGARQRILGASRSSTSSSTMPASSG